MARTDTKCGRCKFRPARAYDNANDLDHTEADPVYWMLRGFCLDCGKAKAEQFKRTANAPIGG